MIYNYNKPSDLLQRQKQTGESYWDMVGAPLPKYQHGKSASQYQQFVEKHRRGLYRYLKANGLPTTALDNMIRQMAWESQYGTSNIARNQHNYAGYGYNGKTYTTFKNDEAFYRAYANLIKKMGAINIADTAAYAKALKNAGYYEDSLQHYSGALSNMKQAEKWIQNEKKYNSKHYGDAQMMLSDFDPDEVEKPVAPVDNTRVNKPQIEQPIQYKQPDSQPVSYEPYKSELPDIMMAYKAIANGQMPLQQMTLNDYGYDDYTEA